MTANPHRASAKISIHALRGEGDTKYRRTVKLDSISIHALRGEGDANLSHSVVLIDISIHALRGEGDGVTFECL